MKKMSLIVAAMLLSMSLSSFAQKGKDCSPACQGKKTECSKKANKKGHHEQPCILDHIPNVTDAQKTKIQALVAQNKKDMQKMHLDMQKKELALKELRLQDQMDSNAANKIIDEKSQLRAQMEKSKLKMHEDIKALLTPEQRAAMPAHPMMGQHHKHGKKSCKGNKKPSNNKAGCCKH